MEESKTVIPALKETYNNLQLNEQNVVDSYTSIVDEYDSLQHGVGVRDISFYNKLFIHGKHSLDLLNRLSTNSIGDLNELEWERTLFTNTEGKIIDRTLLLKFEDYLLLMGGCRDNTKLLKWIKRFVQKDDISITDASTEYKMFEIIGPESDSYLSLIAGDKLEDLQNHNIIRVQIENYFIHCVKFIDVGDVSKYIIVVDSKYADDFCSFLLKNSSVFNLNFVGEAAYDIFRIEHGIPIVPNELNDQVTPCEANLRDEIDFEKRGYVGCEQVKNGSIDSSSSSKLSGFIFDQKLSEDNSELSIHNNNGEQVGVVTSIASQHISENSIGMGYIDSDIEENELVGTDGNIKYLLKISNFPLKR